MNIKHKHLPFFKTSKNYKPHVAVQTSGETAGAAGTAVLHDDGGQQPEDGSSSKPEVGSDRADSGFGSSGSSQKSISPPDIQVPTICLSRFSLTDIFMAMLFNMFPSWQTL